MSSWLSALLLSHTNDTNERNQSRLCVAYGIHYGITGIACIHSGAYLVWRMLSRPKILHI